MIFISFLFFKLVNKYGTTGGYHHPPWFENLYDSESKRRIFLIISFIVRLFLPILLFTRLHPINAMIINQVLIDNIDPIYLVNVNSKLYDRVSYQNWDKVFDLWGYFVSLYPVFYLSNISRLIKISFIFLFIYRFIGVIVWFLTKKEDIFIYFPDLYTALYYSIYFCLLFKIWNKYLIFFLVSLSFYLKILHEKYNHQV